MAYSYYGATHPGNVNPGRRSPAPNNANNYVGENLRRQVQKQYSFPARLAPDYSSLGPYPGGPQPPVNPGGPFGPFNLGPTTDGSGRGRGGGGGKAGPNAAQVRKVAGDLFSFNRAPWLQQYALNDQLTKQLAAYNPDIAGMGKQYQQLAQQQYGQFRTDAANNIAAIARARQQATGQQTAQMQGIMRDLSAQGFNPSQYASNAAASNAAVGQGMTNLQDYMGMVNQNEQGSLADALRYSGLITQGAQGELANARLGQQNAIAQQRVQIMQQQAAAEQAQQQARAEFMLKYGVF